MGNKLPKGWVRTNVGAVALPVASIQPEDAPVAEITYLDIGGIDNERNRVFDTTTIIGRNAPSRRSASAPQGRHPVSTVRSVGFRREADWGFTRSRTFSPSLRARASKTRETPSQQPLQAIAAGSLLL